MSFGKIQNHVIFKAFLRMFPATEGMPGFHYDPLLLHIVPKFCILIVDMVLVLDHSRCDLRKGEHFINLILCVIVGNADGTELSALHSLFHGLVDTGVIRSRLMDPSSMAELLKAYYGYIKLSEAINLFVGNYQSHKILNGLSHLGNLLSDLSPLYHLENDNDKIENAEYIKVLRTSESSTINTY